MHSKSILYLFIIQVFFWSACSSPKEITFTEKDLNIIPLPDQLTLQQGSFAFDEQTVIVVPSSLDQDFLVVFAKPMEIAAGLPLTMVTEKPIANYILLEEDPSKQSEAYELVVASDKIVIKASDKNGFIYGLESILQLLSPQINSPAEVENVDWVIPAVTITDAPQYSWRGFMLDVSRHFFEKEYVFEVIDELAFHKMNKLHLHLVDDQGWRIEIKKYPKLTEVGAWRVDQEDAAWNARRKPELGEKATYGGFFTQDDIKEIVAYASARGVDVIPEIEMPAHVSSAIAAYPELSCKGEPIMVPSGGVWPITDIFCPGQESTFEFLEDVIDEVITLFPYEYVHLGGDEATKTNWETCSHCKARVKAEGLDGVAELQSYFMIRMEKYLASKGKKMIGWDEIMEGGLGPETTIMSWRGFQYGFEASEEGHDVIMTPTSHCYFDYYQGPQDVEPEAFNAYIPLSKVYEFNPALDSMTAEQRKHILGGQANLWAEFITTTSHSEYMMYPRLDALAEALWTKAENKDWMSFADRLQTQFERYEYADINYAKSAFAVTGKDSVNLEEKTIILELATEMPNTDIRYTLDGSDLDENAIKYTGAIVLKTSGTVKAAAFQDGKPFGAPFKKEFYFHKAFGKPVTYITDRHSSYMAKDFTLVDGVNGSLDFHDKKWQGWLNKPMEIVIDLEEILPVRNVKVSSLESQGSGIYFPSGAKVAISENGEDYTDVASVDNPPAKNPGRSLKVFDLNFEETKAQFIKVTVTNPGPFIFLDEVQVY